MMYEVKIWKNDNEIESGYGELLFDSLNDAIEEAKSFENYNEFDDCYIEVIQDCETVYSYTVNVNSISQILLGKVQDYFDKYPKKNSKYYDVRTKNGKDVTLRISDHTYNSKNLRKNDNELFISVVIANKYYTDKNFYLSENDLIFNCEDNFEEIINEINNLLDSL